MAYVDGFVIPIPKKNVKAYASMAKKAARVWIDHGALEVKECVGEDLAVKFGMSFARKLKTKRNETVLFSFIVYKSRTHRDRVNARVMKDPRLHKMAPKEMPFELKNMMYGGFKTLVDIKA
ncbi:MAG: DUF1428 domain-containing protein [Rhodospirillaceae bacterium]|nr:DUF1428 domain-containing protein [Rhodospirillaceae bacterium]